LSVPAISARFPSKCPAFQRVDPLEHRHQLKPQ
jgi:hypothetical protein